MWRVLLLVAGAGAYDWVRGPTDSPDPCPGLYCGRIDRGPGQNVTEVRGDKSLILQVYNLTRFTHNYLGNPSKKKMWNFPH